MMTAKHYSAKTKILSLVLSLLTVFYLIPTSIFAEDDNASAENTDTSEVALSGFENLNEVYEVEELREENVKHFRLEDGSYVAAQYNYPIHYKDEDGKFADINNRLEEGGGIFANSNSRVSFVKKITGSGKLFSLEEGNTKLSMSIIGANKGIHGVVTNNDDAEEDTVLQKKMNLENLTSTVLYEEIFDGVDIEYVVHSLNVKENIIVKEKSDSYSYSFELKLNKLTPEINSDGDVILYDEEGEVKYTIPAPIVYDSGESVAGKEVAYYTLTGSNGKYTLTVTVDPEWMNDESRLFPVTVDPTVTSAEESVYEDSDLVYSQLGYPYLSIVGSAPLHVKMKSLPTLTQSSVVYNASISLDYSSSAGRYFPSVAVYQVLTDWNSNTFSQAEYSAGSGAIDTSVLDYVIGANPQFKYTFDITSLMQGWYDGTENNYGVAFKRFYSSAANIGVTGDIILPTLRFTRPSVSMSTDAPVVTVSYFNGNGVEDYWSYSSQSAGVGGNTSINLANGNMTLAVPTLSTTDSLMPYTPTLVYSSVFANQTYVYGNANTAFGTSYMANGFKLNIGETVIKKQYLNSSGTYEQFYIYADADGTDHNFYVKEGSSSVYLDDDGLQLELTESSGKVIITDTNTKWTREFVSTTSPHTSVLGAWYLSKIVDNVGNAIVFGFDSRKFPTSVSLVPKELSAIEMLKLSYYGSGNLQMIYNPASLDAVVFRYSTTYNGEISASSTSYLRRIDYVHGTGVATADDLISFATSESSTANVVLDASALYSYNSAGFITDIADTLSQQSLTYSWLNSKVSSVKHYADTTLGQTVKYTYGQRYTDVTSSGNDDTIDTDDDTVTRYVFDDRGRSVSVYSFVVIWN